MVEVGLRIEWCEGKIKIWGSGRKWSWWDDRGDDWREKKRRFSKRSEWNRKCDDLRWLLC